MKIVPLTLDAANDFVERMHRHNSGRLPVCRWAIGCEVDGRLVGVSIMGNPSAPALQTLPHVVEIRRVCTDGTPNACSKLYGASRRGLRAVGFEPIYTYSLPEEGGASLRAAGFKLDKEDAGGAAADWHNRPKHTTRPVGDDLVGGKWRWVG